ncbi:adhesion G protein-coupled receptor L4-like [Rhincodon typus]|uniref:adhesion G protein-coupled receptor L4-like n=1 Tax=Rhincodon typus TaxID=259920 RepID=UPI00202F2B41|nr:adhesion G protein-coupled receptor L4-like [Rhincodon typus]
MKALVKTVNNLLQPDEMAVWNEIGDDERRKSATKLLHTMETSALGISHHLKRTTELVFKESDVALKLYAFDLSRDKQPHPHANLNGNHISISQQKTEMASSNGTLTIIFLQYSSIGSLLRLSNSSHDRDHNGTTMQLDYVVNSPIVAAAIKSNPPSLYLMDYVAFTLKHLEPLEKRKALCVFWNYSAPSMEGEWATEGCKTLHFNATHTTCRCNHLTNFAVLMSSFRISVSAKDVRRESAARKSVQVSPATVRKMQNGDKKERFCINLAQPWDGLK